MGTFKHWETGARFGMRSPHHATNYEYSRKRIDENNLDFFLLDDLEEKCQ
jgi:hypothetical protein